MYTLAGFHAFWWSCLLFIFLVVATLDQLENMIETTENKYMLSALLSILFRLV